MITKDLIDQSNLWSTLTNVIENNSWIIYNNKHYWFYQLKKSDKFDQDPKIKGTCVKIKILNPKGKLVNMCKNY